MLKENLLIEWYVIRTFSGNEEKVKTLLETVGVESKIIYREMYLKRNGQVKLVNKKLFPGYLFAITEIGSSEFDLLVNVLRHENTGYFYNLKQDREETPALSEKEKDYLSRLAGDKNVVEASVGYIEGDKVTITEGPLVGYESKIVYIDRHKKIAKVNIDFIGETRIVSVPLEIISKR